MFVYCLPASCISFQFNWILTSLDAHTVDFQPFKYDFTNFTVLRLVDFTRPFVQHSLRSIVTEVISVFFLLPRCFFSKEIIMGRTLDFTDFSGGLDTEAALIYDAVHLFAVALRQVREAQNLQTMSIECGPFPQSWPHGSTITNFMRLSNIPGLTGDVRFDAWGRRSQFSLDLLNLFEEHDLAKVGVWDKINGVSFPGLHTDRQGSKEDESPMMNKSLVVTTIINAPYTMIRVSE